MHQKPDPPGSPAGRADGVVWLRPEYQGRQGELVTLAAGARLVGVSAAAVSNWQNRYPEDFPGLALLTGPPHKRTKWAVAVELVAFARDQRTREHDRTGPRNPQRPGAEIAAEQTAHYEEVLRTLTEREQRQKQALARTRTARRTAEEKLARARARLTAEVDAVVRLGIPAARTTTTEKEIRP
ncbi:hypothetical protein [Streptomyces acidiscabies]|uniref:Uncharacterized protein n=1 Tax=Streptomyces acidiscabies TaxID=42234 RepID=A0AAP6EKN6_9ACTN|nr:hypothetical protein [Streptomyces acidiscabies]MBZ3918150.1 hypothetical protein [Streptomyces acidiscabies]MDX2966452.1 hypothetical protein [Streptomyces acidiscabies]MDX3796398.1 hypothetical protein [Streptomyces acidiscabies]